MDIIEKIISGNIINCKTEAAANCLLKQLHEMRYHWISGSLLSEYNSWDLYKENTCYSLTNSYPENKIGVACDNRSYFDKKNNTIINFNIHRMKHIAEEFLQEKYW